MNPAEPTEHFLQGDVTSGVNPHPLFDLEFYRAQVPGLDSSSAVEHYLDHGASMGLSPHPLFDPAYYQQQAGASPDPLESYLSGGWRSGFDPHPLFSVDYYLALAPDVAAAGVEPLTHYVTHGGRELRAPHPLFDPAYYQQQAGASPDPLESYLSGGWRSGFDPHPLFSVDYYLALAPDVAAAGVEPLTHYVTQRGRELRTPHPLFDPAYYQQQAGASPDPLESYLSGGWRSGFDPHPLFSVDYYLALAPDVAAAGVEPLTHYVTQGGRELRAHHPLFDPAYYLSRVGSDGVADLPLVHYLRTGGVIDPTPHFSSRSYLARSEEARRSPLPPLVHWLTVGAGMGIPPSSRVLPEVVSDLLLGGNSFGALLALTYHHSDGPRFPARRALSYGFGDPAQFEVDDGLLVGGLPGVVVEERLVVGAVPPERPTNLARGALAAVVRPDRVLASGTVNLALQPMGDILVPELGFDTDDIDWLLSVVPSLWEQRANSSGLTLVLPKAPSSFVLEAVRAFAGWEGVRCLGDGELRGFRGATIARAESGSLARFRDALWRGRSSRGRRIVLVTHPEDPFDDEAVSLLRRTVLEVGGVAVDVAWGARAVRSALEDAGSVLVAEGLAHVALLSPPESRLVVMGASDATTVERVEGAAVAVERLVLDPIRAPHSQKDSRLLDVSAAVAHIESSVAP